MKPEDYKRMFIDDLDDPLEEHSESNEASSPPTSEEEAEQIHHLWELDGEPT
jgi:hypothetical protein